MGEQLVRSRCRAIPLRLHSPSPFVPEIASDLPWEFSLFYSRLMAYQRFLSNKIFSFNPQCSLGGPCFSMGKEEALRDTEVIWFTRHRDDDVAAFVYIAGCEVRF